jgi:hypothetical protein
MIVLAIWVIVGLAVATAVYRLRVHTKPKVDTSNREVTFEMTKAPPVRPV